MHLRLRSELMLSHLCYNMLAFVLGQVERAGHRVHQVSEVLDMIPWHRIDPLCSCLGGATRLVDL